MTISDVIRKKLTDQLFVEKLEIVDDSVNHIGHIGYQDGGETHFNIVIVSSDFTAKSKIARHRMVYAILEQEMTDRIHALSIVALTPEEAE